MTSLFFTFLNSLHLKEYLILLFHFLKLNFVLTHHNFIFLSDHFPDFYITIYLYLFLFQLCKYFSFDPCYLLSPSTFVSFLLYYFSYAHFNQASFYFLPRLLNFSIASTWFLFFSFLVILFYLIYTWKDGLNNSQRGSFPKIWKISNQIFFFFKKSFLARLIAFFVSVYIDFFLHLKIVIFFYYMPKIQGHK